MTTGTPASTAADVASVVVVTHDWAIARLCVAFRAQGLIALREHLLIHRTVWIVA